MKWFHGPSPYTAYLLDPSSGETRLGGFSILEYLDVFARGDVQDFEACWARLAEQSQEEGSGTVMELPEHRLLADVPGVLLLWSMGEQNSVKVFGIQDIEFVYGGSDTEVVLHFRPWIGVAALILFSQYMNDEVIRKWAMEELESVDVRFEYT